jgi:hypothetical protein
VLVSFSLAFYLTVHGIRPCARRKCEAAASIALLLQPTNRYAEAADYWRRYLTSDGQSEWAARARRSLKFCEMQVNLIASA